MCVLFRYSFVFWRRFRWHLLDSLAAAAVAAVGLKVAADGLRAAVVADGLKAVAQLK